MLHISERAEELKLNLTRVASKLPKKCGENKERSTGSDGDGDGEVNFSRFGICQSFRSSARVSFRQKFCRLQPVSHSDSAGCVFACLRFIKIH